MTLALHEDAFGDPRNVCFLATASDIAYLPETEAQAALREPAWPDRRQARQRRQHPGLRRDQ